MARLASTDMTARSDHSTGAQAGPGEGACFGFSVRSHLQWRMLRPGEGTLLTVEGHESDPPRPPGPALMTWQDADRSPTAALFEDDCRFLLHVKDVGWYMIDPEAPTISVPEAVADRIELRLWGVPTALCRIRAGDLVLHAATVEVDGHAIALAAPGRFGKTTLACAFLQAGHRLLSEDLTGCRLAPGPVVWPGAAGVRVRRDVYERLELHGTSVVAEDAEGLQLSLDHAIRGDASPVPLCAVVLLRRSDVAGVMSLVPPERALPDLWAVSLRLPTDDDRSRCFRRIAELTRKVPVWNLERQLTFDDLPFTVEQIVDRCLP